MVDYPSSQGYPSVQSPGYPPDYPPQDPGISSQGAYDYPNQEAPVGAPPAPYHATPIKQPLPDQQGFSAQAGGELLINCTTYLQYM